MGFAVDYYAGMQFAEGVRGHLRPLDLLECLQG